MSYAPQRHYCPYCGRDLQSNEDPCIYCGFINLADLTDAQRDMAGLHNVNVATVSDPGPIGGITEAEIAPVWDMNDYDDDPVEADFRDWYNQSNFFNTVTDYF